MQWAATPGGYGEGPPSPYIEGHFAETRRTLTFSYGEGPPSPYIEGSSSMTSPHRIRRIRGGSPLPLH